MGQAVVQARLPRPSDQPRTDHEPFRPPQISRSPPGAGLQPHLAGSRSGKSPHLGKRRPARRQPGAARADDGRTETAALEAAGGRRHQGNHGGLSLGQPAGLRLRALVDRRGSDPRGRDHCRAHAVARSPDRSHLRIAGRRGQGHHPSLQLHLHGAARARVRDGRGRHCRYRRQGHPAGQGKRPEAPRRALAAGIFARELFLHRGRVLGTHLRSGHGRLAAHARRQDHLQPAQHGGAGRAASSRRPDRIFLPAHQEPRQRDRVGAYA